jgi:glycosyltransferase involved in cell wall biosynthesis
MGSMISVVVPAYNARPFIREALASIFREAAFDLDVIVVDDGSTDGTADVALEFPVRCLRSEHRGVSAARNLGLAAATGDLLAWLDADDRWASGRFDGPLQALASDPKLDVVYGYVQQFTAMKHPEQCIGAPRPGRLPGSMLIRRDAFLRVGGFDESLRIGEFMDWLVRARHCGLREAMIEQLCLERRIHGHNLGISARTHLGDYLRVARRSINQGRTD